MRAFISGGAGFIGSHLAERCLEEKWSVTVLDDLSTGAIANIAHLKKHPTFSYTIDTIFNEPLVAEMVDACDVVFHLAAAVGVRLVVEDPIRTIETNIQGTAAVLRCAAKKQKPVVITSTSEVYGKNTAVPFREDADCVIGATTRSRWSYACSKAMDEFLALAYHHDKKLPVTIVRLFNTVGPRQTSRYGMVLPTFVRQALLSEPITVHGDGHQTRCFGYVKDVTEALVRLVKSPGAVGQVLNIGNDEEVSIQTLAEHVKMLTKSTSRIVHVPYDIAYGPGFEDMVRRVPCLDKLERLLGYRPHTPLEKIILQLAAAMKTELIPYSTPAPVGTSIPAFSDNAAVAA